MNAPDKCPKCGADSIMQSAGSYFRCGTWATSDGTVDQSRDCTSAQRDALAARVKELEAWIADLDEIGRHSGKSDHREWNGEIGWLLKGQVAYVGEVKP